MASSSLDPNLHPRPDRQLGKGHGTGVLGPSDTSDSGSDVQGGPGLYQETGIGLDTGTTSDPEQGAADGTAGPDLGDANLDSDTDAVGTGEHASAGRDTLISDGQDIDTDQVQSIGSIVEEESVADDADRKEKKKPR